MPWHPPASADRIGEGAERDGGTLREPKTSGGRLEGVGHKELHLCKQHLQGVRSEGRCCLKNSDALVLPCTKHVPFRSLKSYVPLDILDLVDVGS